MTGSGVQETLAAAARFGAEQPGWVDRVIDRHTQRADGSCAGCGCYRPVSWPCVLLHIARRAAQIQAARAQRGVRSESPAGGRCPTNPAASRLSPPAGAAPVRAPGAA